MFLIVKFEINLKYTIILFILLFKNTYLIYNKKTIPFENSFGHNEQPNWSHYFINFHH